MDCLQAETIQAFLAGKLAADQLAAVEAHARACDSCERLLAVSLDVESNATRAATPATPGRADRPGDPDQPLAPGNGVGRYTIIARVGRGGMGESSAAYDTTLGRRVALKLLRSRGPTRLALDEIRLLREAQAAAR